MVFTSLARRLILRQNPPARGPLLRIRIDKVGVNTDLHRTPLSGPIGSEICLRIVLIERIFAGFGDDAADYAIL
jgi:hypothetical protein